MTKGLAVIASPPNVTLFFLGWLDFSEETENREKRTFEAVKTMMSKLPSPDGNYKEMRQLVMRSFAKAYHRGTQDLPATTAEKASDD